MNLKPYIAYGLSHGADEIELYAVCNQEDSVTVRNQAVEKIESAQDRGLAVRVFHQKRFGFSYTTSLIPDDIHLAIDQAIANAQFTHADKFLQLPKPKKAVKKPTGIYDKNICTLTTPDRIALALATEKAAYAYDTRITKTESVSCSSTIAESWLANSHGINIHQQKTACGVMAEIIAEDRGDMQSAYDYAYATQLKKVSPKKVGETAAERAITLLNAGGITTGIYDILLPPKTAIQLLSVLSPSFDAENVQKKKSLFCGKKNKKIGSSLLTLTDNPYLAGGLGSYQYDAEGTPGTTKNLITKGILKNFLYDTYTAAKDGLRSTGNATRGTIKAEPGIDAANLYIVPGKKSSAQLLKNISRGIVIHSLMGLHTVDTITGDFSLGATGQLIENGKITRSIKDMAIAGNLLTLLKSITAIGNDLTFSGSIGSPTLVVKKLQIAGKN
jgi:PmbA protein